MASNVDVRITADVADLTAKFALAKAESSALTSELNKLAREAAAAGGQMSAEMKAGLQDAAQAAVKARAEMQALGNQLKQAHDSTGGFLSGLTAVKGGLEALGLGVTIGGLEAFGERILTNTAHLQHEADVLQLHVTAYQAYIQAAVDSGVDTDVVDGAIRRFTVNVGNAQVGMGAAAGAFVEMGISANQSNEALLQQVSTFMLTTDAGNRARLSQELFGRSGAELIPLYKQWAQGAADLTAKYDAMGRIIDPGVTEAAEQADIKLNQSWEHLKAAAAGPVTDLTQALGGMLDVVQGAPVAADGWAEFGANVSISLESIVDPAGAAIDALKQLAALQAKGEWHASAGGMSRPPPGVKLDKPPEAEEVAALDAIDAKLRERKDLEERLAIATKTRDDATAAGDATGHAKAVEVVTDLQKQLDALNRVPTDTGVHKAAAAARAELHALVEDARQISTELDAEARSDAQRDVALAKDALKQKQTVLDEEYRAHRITAQQKYDATIEALDKEVAAERAALEQIIHSDLTSAEQKHDALNQEIVLDATANDAIAQAHRQLTEELQAEDRKRLESWREVNSQIEGAEGELVSDIFTKRQGLATDLMQIGFKMLQEELTNDQRMLTQRWEVNEGILASDRATASGGLIWKTLVGTQETAMVVTNQAAQTAAVTAGAVALLGIQATAAATGAAISATTNATEISHDAAKAAAGAYAALAGIPVVGPFLAPVAAAVAFAAVEAFGSFDRGLDVVPRDMVAQIHAGERIVPASDNRAMISALSGNGGRGGSGGDVHLNYAPTINAPQQKSLAKMLDDESSTMVSWIEARVRDGALKVA